MSGPFAAALERVRSDPRAPLRVTGCVQAVVGHSLELAGLPARVGSIVEIRCGLDRRAFAEVVGFRKDACIAIPLTGAAGIARGDRVQLSPHANGSPAPSDCLGRILDGLGQPLDGGPAPRRTHSKSEVLELSLLKRERITQPLDVGVRAINALHAIGKGSRIGIFAGSGIGKSTLLGQIARNTRADVIVLGLVGERRREVREFVEEELGESLSRSVVVVATSDDSPALRRRSGLLASELALTLAREGRDVLFLMDSLSRFCAAQREIGLAAGEPPATRGYPPSVWSQLPQLLERAGTLPGSGSVTGIYTVLVEGDDLEEPVADAARSLLDGHLVLSRRIAETGSFPAIDPLASLSRVMDAVVSPEHRTLAGTARSLLARLADAEDLIRIGAYTRGSDPQLDEALGIEPGLRAFLCQAREERADFDEALTGLRNVMPGARP